MSDNIKTCVRCEHYRGGVLPTRYPTCDALANHAVDCVTGRSWRYIVLCETARGRWNDSCGPSGKLWTPRRSLWQRVKGWFA